jgi:hypothetical protein
MTKKSNLRRGATIGLALVSLFLLARILLQATGWWGGLRSASASPASVPPASAGTLAPRAQTGPVSAVPEPMLRLDLLKALDSRPLPELPRSPFEFAPTPAEIKAKEIAAQRVAPPPPPPPPPPVPFKAMGYQQDEHGQRTAYLSDDDGTYIVHEGQEFGQHFKVLKITDTMVEVQDETYHQTVQLPYPQ